MGMIAYLDGKVVLVRDGSVIINVGGVGYKVGVGPELVNKLHVGDKIQVYTYTQVREDILALYGFETLADLDLFELLISVSGIGPKAAMGILSAASVDKIRASIVNQDPTLLSSVSGVGKKTAEKVVIELKNKVGATGSLFDAHGKAEDVYEALTQLGFKPNEARDAIASMPADCVGPENQLKYCLSNLNKK
jgi:Holliday junction DNA helicase RuvA